MSAIQINSNTEELRPEQPHRPCIPSTAWQLSCQPALALASIVGTVWDLLPPNRYMWASVQTVRGCPKHCSFCSVWRTDGQIPRQRTVEAVIHELVQLRRMGYRFVVLADDNFYPVPLTDIALAQHQNNLPRVAELETLRAERFELVRRLAKLPNDMVFYTL